MLAWKRRLIIYSYRIGDIISILFSMMICFSLIKTDGVQFLGINSKMEALGFIIVSAAVVIFLSTFLGVYDILLQEDNEIGLEKWAKPLFVSLLSYFIVNFAIMVLDIKTDHIDLMVFIVIFTIASFIIRELNAFIFRLGRYRSEGMNNVLIVGKSVRGARYINTILKNPQSYINIIGYVNILDEIEENTNLLKEELILNKSSIDFNFFDRMPGVNSVMQKDIGTYEMLKYGFMNGRKKMRDESKKAINVNEEYSKINYKGHMSELSDILTKTYVDEIVVAEELSSKRGLETFLQDIQDMGITITMLLKKKEKNPAKTHVAMFGDLPALKFHTVSLDQNQLMIKRLMDVIGASVGMILFGIAYLIFAPIIKLESPGPVIFKQPRVGKNGRVFYIWKFRSMCNDAEKKKEALLSLNEMKGNMFKMSNDPRVTKIGNFLRKTSIDELPQFYNVLVGDMSLVGTRPPTLKEVENYQIHQRKRISITPGITGMWQISGRSEIKDFEEVVRMDTEYIENWSVMLDIKILLKTIVVVLNRHGSK